MLPQMENNLQVITELETKKRVGLVIEPSLWEQLKAHAGTRNLGASYVLRELVIYELKNNIVVKPL
jgi:hypothetical protein